MSENLSDNSTAINSNNAETINSDNNVTVNANNNVADDSNNTVNISADNNIADSSNNTANTSADNNIADGSNNTANESTSTAGVNMESATSNKVPIKKEPKYKFETVDIIMLPVVFILAFLCTKYYNLNTSVATLGLGATAYIVLYVISVLVYAKLKSVKLNSESIILSTLMILLAISFTVFYNYSLGIFMQIAMSFMLIYLPVTVFNKLIKSETSALILYDYINALVLIPIHNATSFWLCIFSKRGKSSSSTKTKYFLHIFLGLLIGTPFIMIVVFLLSSADATFKNIFDNLFNFDISIPKNIGTLIWSLPMATYLYALIYGSSIEDNSKSFNIDKFNKTMDNAASIPKLSLYTVNAVICCFYILFIGIQAIYFIDVLGGSLPADFTYSDYARRGFFELLAVALINIVFIAVAKILSVKNENNTLPIKKDKKLAIIGDFAFEPRYQGAGSSMVNAVKVDNVENITEEFDFEVIGMARGYSREDKEVDENVIKEAIDLAKVADIVLFFFGLNEDSESEGLDREHLRIPQNQIDLMEELFKANDNIVGVISAGSSIEMPWHHYFKAILHGYLFGQAGMGACFDILSGNVSPSGKLTETIIKKYEDVPNFKYYPSLERNSEYREGIFVGYRYYQSALIPVLYRYGSVPVYLLYTSLQKAVSDIQLFVLPFS